MAHNPIPEPCDPIQLGEFLLGDYRQPAVYFLYDEGVLVYVGQTTTLKWRIETHLQEGVKTFDAVAFAPCCVSRLLEVESYYIRKFAPQYNQCGIAKAVRREESYIPDDPPLYEIEGQLYVRSLGLSRIMGCDRAFAKELLALIQKPEIPLGDAFYFAATMKQPEDYQPGDPKGFRAVVQSSALAPV